MPAANIVVGQRVDRAKVQRAKELRREMTPEERLLWEHLRANRLGGLHFRRQQVIDGFIADFYCHARGLVVEVDGGVHREQAEYDEERDQIIAARGLRVLRIRNGEVISNLAGTLQLIAAYAEGEPNPPTPFPAREGGEGCPGWEGGEGCPGREGGDRSSPPRAAGSPLPAAASSPLPASGRGRGRGLVPNNAR